MSEVSCIMRVCVSDTVTILQKVVYHKIAPSFTCDVTVFLVVYLRLSYVLEGRYLRSFVGEFYGHLKEIKIIILRS